MPKATLKKVEKAVGKNVLRQAVKAAAPTVRGKGNYFTDWIGGGAKALGKGVSSFVEKPFNAFADWISGHGKYKVHNNSILKTLRSNGPPTFGHSNGNVRVAHREYLGDIISANGTFTLNFNQQSINPTNEALFPWLSQIAPSFEEYQVNGMIFEYKPTSGFAVSSSNASLGTVVMATQYNPYDAAFSGKLAMEAYEFSTSSSPAESMIHPVECARSQTPLARYFVNPSLTSDLRFVECGCFTLATVGMQAVETCGELWISYDITFFKPKLSEAGNDGTIAHFNFLASPGSNSSLVYTQANEIGAKVDLGTTNTIKLYSLPAGYYVSYLLYYCPNNQTTNQAVLTSFGQISNWATGGGVGSRISRSSVLTMAAAGGGANCVCQYFNVTDNQANQPLASGSIAWSTVNIDGTQPYFDVMLFRVGVSPLSKRIDRTPIERQLADIRRQLDSVALDRLKIEEVDEYDECKTPSLLLSSLSSSSSLSVLPKSEALVPGVSRRIK